ncbi:MAG: 50S ribosomal protein L25 [Desulfobulbus propionicus]|nr:MAG: 50S ribosomal protein L25 [Desulfobulbus propionicus]
MLQVEIDSAVRTVFGKGEMRRLRNNEFTPASLYSGGTPPIALQFKTADLFRKLKFIHGRNAVITVKIAGDTAAQRHVLVKEIQKDVVTDELIHVDFLEIDLEKELEFVVPLKYTGKARGVEMGGDLQVYRDSIRLKGRPLEIPDEVEANISNLDKAGAPITCGDLQVTGEVTMLEAADVACIEVV